MQCTLRHQPQWLNVATPLLQYGGYNFAVLLTFFTHILADGTHYYPNRYTKNSKLDYLLIDETNSDKNF